MKTARGVPFVGEADYERMLALLRQSWAGPASSATMTVGDLEFWRHQADSPPLEETCRLWPASTGELSGFAWAAAGCIDVAVARDSWPLLAEMMDWAEAFLERRDGPRAELTTSALETDTAHEEELRRRGYRRTAAHHHWYRTHSLQDSVATAVLPASTDLRTVTDAGAWAEVASLIDRTGAAPRFTAAGWRALMSSPTYRPELDLLAFAPDGRPVAHCTAWLDVANRTLLVEPVGCDPGHRRQGLARTLILEALRRGRALSATTALVACDGMNDAANAIYEALGFRVGRRKWVWAKAR